MAHVKPLHLIAQTLADQSLRESPRTRGKLSCRNEAIKRTRRASMALIDMYPGRTENHSQVNMHHDMVMASSYIVHGARQATSINSSQIMVDRHEANLLARAASYHVAMKLSNARGVLAWH